MFSVRGLVLLTVLCTPVFYGGQEAEAKSVKGASSQDVDLKFSGYVRARYGAIFEGEGNPTFVGINDGFFLDAARITLDAKKKNLSARVSIDGAVDRRNAMNTAEGRVDVGLKDGWLGYRFTDSFSLQVGQFKTPFDREELQSTRDMLFIERSVASRGVRGTEGYNAPGMSLSREVGAMGHIPMALGAKLDMNLWLAVSNGSGANRPTNDNDRLAYTARLDAGMGETVRIGGAFRFNQVTNGAPPDELVDEVLAYTADLSVHHDLGAVAVTLLAVYWRQARDSLDVPTEPTVTTEGYQGSLGLHLPMNLTLAYRASGYDPTLAFEVEDEALEVVLESDALLYHTVGLSHELEHAPLKVQGNYTVTQEETGRELENDRFDVLVQAVF